MCAGLCPGFGPRAAPTRRHLHRNTKSRHRQTLSGQPLAAPRQCGAGANHVPNRHGGICCRNISGHPSGSCAKTCGRTTFVCQYTVEQRNRTNHCRKCASMCHGERQHSGPSCVRHREFCRFQTLRCGHGPAQIPGASRHVDAQGFRFAVAAATLDARHRIRNRACGPGHPGSAACIKTGQRRHSHRLRVDVCRRTLPHGIGATMHVCARRGRRHIGAATHVLCASKENMWKNPTCDRRCDYSRRCRVCTHCDRKPCICGNGLSAAQAATQTASDRHHTFTNTISKAMNHRDVVGFVEGFGPTAHALLRRLAARNP